jgi:hypothetical protein
MNSRLTAILLIAVNVGIGIAALTQRVGYAEVLLLYWAETVVIGVLAIPKLLIVALFKERIDTLDQLRDAGSRALAVGLGLTFAIAFFAFVWMLLFAAIVALPSILEHSDRAAGLAVPHGPRRGTVVLQTAFIALALSHAFSFFVNFLGHREFRGGSLLRILVEPVLRTWGIIAVIALALVVAYAQPAIARTTAFALIVIGTKTAVDLHAHLAERKRFAAAGPEVAA